MRFVRKTSFSKTTFIAGFAIVGLLALLLANSAVAEETVPFKATGSGLASAVVVSPPPNLILWISISGAGKATHMGRISIIQHHFVDVNSLTFYGGTYIWTAANGDTIFGIYDGYLVPTSIGFEIHGQFTIDGGTGELINARGGGPASGMQFFDNTFILKLDGRISYE
jgi:hypothetical protein